MNRRGALLLLALIVSAYLAFKGGDGAPAAGVVEPTEGADRPRNERAARAGAEVEIFSLRQREGFSTSSRKLFAPTDWAPPKKAAPGAAPPAPTAPPLPFTMLGKRHDGARWEVFLTRGEQMFIVQESQTIDTTYRVESIKPPQMVLVYLPLDQRQTMHIGGAE